MSVVSVTKKIFGSQGPTLQASGDLQPGQETLALAGELRGGQDFDAFGARLQFGGNAGVELRMIAGEVDLGPAAPSEAEERLAPLGTFPPPSGKRWSEVRVRGGVDVSGSGSTGGSVAVQVSAKADLGFEYRGVRAVPAADDPKVAVERLLGNALLPFSFDIQSFKPDQWHELSFDASLGFSATVSAGKTLTLDSHSGPLQGLLPEDSPEVAAQITLLAKAALGLELVDRLRVGAGRLPASRPAWVRYRLERLNRHKVSLSASLALELLYNREVLHHVLSTALGRVGYPQIQAQLREIAEVLDPGVLTVDGLRNKLSEELFELAKDVLPIDEATGKIAERASGLLALVERVQKQYEELDGEFQGLVDHFLGTFSLAEGKPLRDKLVELRDLGQKTPQELVEGFTQGRFGSLEPLVELLLQHSLNELLLAGSGALKRGIERLSSEAGKLLDLIDEVDDSDLADVLAKATGSDKVRRVVDLLRGAPGSVAEFRDFLEQRADKALRGLVERLAGRITGKIDPKRLARLREWAEKVHEALTTGASIDQRLAEEIDKIKDRVGFVLSLSIDRLTRRGALVDVELDPGSNACRQAFRSLSAGNLEEFTERLPFEEDAADGGAEPPDPPFRFHHFVLVSDRSTELTWIFAPTIGAGTRRTRKAFDASRIEIRQQPAAARTGTYSGGLVLSTGAAREGLLRSWMGSIWLRSVAEGRGPAIADPYDSVRHEIHLATQRFDDELDGAKRSGLDQLLRFLGFGASALTSRVPAEASATKIQAELVVAGADPAAATDPIDRLLRPLDRTKARLRNSRELDDAFLGAAHEWLSEPLIRARWGDLPQNVVLPAIVASTTYRERLRKAEPSWAEPFRFAKGAETLRVRATPAGTGPAFAPILRALAQVRLWASGPYARLGRAWTALAADGDALVPDRLVELARAFRRAARVSTPPLAFWDSPLLQHWLLFTRLRAELGDQQLDVKGVASISWRIGDADWQPTQRVVMP